MNDDYPLITVDWSLIVDYGSPDFSDVDHGAAPDGPEYAYCDAIRPDNMELRVHIEGDDSEWLTLGEVPVYLAHANDTCSAKGRALFDRLFTRFSVPQDVRDRVPDDHVPYRPDETSDSDDGDDSSGDGAGDNNNSSSSSSSSKISPMSKELDAAGPPVQAVDAPGTLVFQLMSVVAREGTPTSPSLPRPRDTSQLYTVRSTLSAGGDPTMGNISWKLVTSQRLHWSARQRGLPLLSLEIRDKSTNEKKGTVRLQLAPLILHPGQAVDAWFTTEDNSGGSSGEVPLSIRIVAQYVPDSVPQTRSKGKNKKSNTMVTAPSWGAGKTKTKKLASRTTQVVLKKDPGLSNTRATKSEFDSEQLLLIAELGQQLRGAKMHVQIAGLRKLSSSDASSSSSGDSSGDSSNITVACCDLSSDKSDWEETLFSTTASSENVKAMVPSSFLLPLDSTTTSPLLGFSLFRGDGDGTTSDTIHGKLLLPLFPFVLGDGHVSDTWYPMYSTSDGNNSKVAEVRLIVQIHTLNATRKGGSRSKKKSLLSSSSSSLNASITQTQQQQHVVTDRTLIVNVKKAITIAVGKSLHQHVVAPRVTVTLVTSVPGGNDITSTSASTSFLDYVAPAATSGGSSSSTAGERIVQEMDSRVSSGSLDAVWREQLYLDLPASATNDLSSSVLRFDISDANSSPETGASIGRIPSLVFASGTLEIGDELALGLARPMSTSGESWITLSGTGGAGGGHLLVDVSRGPLPPSSPLPTRKGGSRSGRGKLARIGFGDEVASMPSQGNISEEGSRSDRSDRGDGGSGTDLAGVVHLSMSDLSGIGIERSRQQSGGDGSSSSSSCFAFVRARAVRTKSRGADDAPGVIPGENGALTYALETSKITSSTTAAEQERSGTFVWDEPMTLLIPRTSSRNVEEEEEETEWIEGWSVVLSVYAAEGASGYDLIAESHLTLREALGLEKGGDGNARTEPMLLMPGRGKRTSAGASPMLRFRMETTDVGEEAPTVVGEGSSSSLSAGSGSSSSSSSMLSSGAAGDDQEELQRMEAVTQIKKTFYSLDKDRSSTVTMEELVESLMGNQTTADYLTSNDVNLKIGGDEEENRIRLTRLFKRMDTDGNGIVTWNEFQNYVLTLQRLAASGVVQQPTLHGDISFDSLLENGGGGGGGGDMSEPPPRAPDSRRGSRGDVLDQTNLPNWANTKAAEVGRLPLESLTNGNSKKTKNNAGGGGSSSVRRKRKGMVGKKKKGSATPLTSLLSEVKGPPQHQLIFEDSFRWNRKNFDLPKKKSKKEIEIARLEKEEKRKKQMAVDPSDKAEALEKQVQAMREQAEERDQAERKKTSASLRSIAMMTKRAREAESLLKSSFSGQSTMAAPPPVTTFSGEGGSAEYLDLQYRFKQLEEENKKLKKRLNDAERRELDMLDERADGGGGGGGLSGSGISGDENSLVSEGGPPGTSRSIRGRAAVRVEELTAENGRLTSELESKRDAMETQERIVESKLLSKESDIELLGRKNDSVQDELDVERERTKALRKEIKEVVRRLARYVNLFFFLLLLLFSFPQLACCCKVARSYCFLMLVCADSN